MIRVGITQGDINGIGPEVIIKALADPRMSELFVPVVYGSSKVFSYYRKGLSEGETFSYQIVSGAREARPKRVNLVETGTGEVRIEPGTATREGGIEAVNALRRAADDLAAGDIDVVVTAPINKENVQEAGFGFTGHTEFFADRFGGEPLMVMCSERMKVGLATIHVPLAQVSGMLSPELIVQRLEQLKRMLVTDFRIVEPRIAVLAMYHDQGLIPFKSLSTGGVNFTASLPVVRTSPDHGVAYDIAGRGVADETSLRDALYAATDIFRNRRWYAEISANPLKHYERERGADVSVKDLKLSEGHEE